MAQVKIGPEFFAKELREYADWKWAFIREAFQNCIDAPGSSCIEFQAIEQDGKTIVTWSNDGKPMDLYTLEHKLLSLGGTGKDGSSSVGGFGKAKTLLYFAHDSYEIQTGNILVRGRGGDYEIAECVGRGTRSVVVIPGLHAVSLMKHAKNFVSLAQWSGVVKLGGEPFRPSLYKGSLRRELSFGKVYTNKSYENLLVVRIGGIPMFTKEVRFGRCVVVELSGSSLERLTSNRDSLLWRFSSELQELVTQLAVDRRSALSAGAESREVFGSQLLAHVSKADMEAFLEASVESQTSEAAAGGSNCSSVSSDTGEASCEPTSDTERFVIYNKTQYKIPEHFIPGKMGSYARKLSSMWSNILVELHRLTDRSAAFSTGFVFDHSDEHTTLAMFERHNGNNVYYINPTLAKFKKRFALTDRDTLIALAAHEFVHGSYKLSYHDEDFAARLTLLMALVMKNRKRFNKCFAV